MEIFAKIVKGLKPLIAFAKNSLDVPQDSEYASVLQDFTFL